MNDDGTVHGRVNMDEQRLGAARLLLAYELIFERTYGIDLGVELPVPSSRTGPSSSATSRRGPTARGGRRS